MKVLEYLNTKMKDCYYTQALNKLKEEFGIKVSVDERFPDLVVLNYSQIDSPKNDPIVQECRSLVLSIPKYDFCIPEPILEEPFKVVSRAFDRFFNVNEVEATQEENLDFSQLQCYEKIDGSLISVFYTEDYGWMYRTKSMLMPEGEIMGHKLTWKELIETSLNWPECTKYLFRDTTYIFEVVSPENRVVTRYTSKKAYLLAARYNDGNYITLVDSMFNRPEKLKFDNFTECKSVVDSLPNLEEGFVAYNKQGVPVCKIKSPKYILAHKLRGGTTPTPKRIMDMIFTNEQSEYLSIFPEDYNLFTPYLEAYKDLECAFLETALEYINIEDQKEFALAVKDCEFKGMLFTKRQQPDLKFKDIFSRLTNNAKYRLVEGYIK